MKAIVFIAPNKVDAQPFTTSDIVAECAGVQHHTVTRLLQKHEADFEEFGILRFDIEEITGRGQPAKHYQLNEEQATLLITYLKNTPQVRQFKKNLVRQFGIMKRQLQQWHVVRECGKAAHRKLTDVVRDRGYSQWTYRHLTDLSYKKVTGMTAAQLRANRGAGKGAIAKDYLTPDELAEVEKLDNLMAALLDTGLDYHAIKDMLLQVSALQIAS